MWSHEETGNGITYARDKRVAEWAASAGVLWREIPQNGVVRRLQNRDGWARNWEERMSEPLLAAPEQIHCAGADEFIGEVPSCRELGLEARGEGVDLKGGAAEGMRLLKSFIENRGHRYQREMSSPNVAYRSCSRLSPYLAFGCLSLRTVVQAVRAAAGQQMPKTAARSVVSRFHWHCHFMQKLESESAIEWRAFNSACNDLRKGASDPESLAAWKEGRTGYPFIDACMRSLVARGWINFRMRAMLVSFASYHLWLDWRVFKDWLACQFIDYEPGIHISQVQMQSGLTGINTLRIYNPVKQGQDHDAKGEFIYEWVPELREVPADFIHEPWKMPEMIQLAANCRLGTDYPLPVVDLKEAVRHARAEFSALRKRDDYWEASRQVLQRHGSRKGGARRNMKKPQQKKVNQAEFSFDSEDG
jgi:deoxyribodipyrimidine photo-lyase